MSDESMTHCLWVPRKMETRLRWFGGGALRITTCGMDGKKQDSEGGGSRVVMLSQLRP